MKNSHLNLRLQIIFWIILILGLIGFIGNGKKPQTGCPLINKINRDNNMIENSKFDIEAFVGKKEKNYLTLRKSTKVEVYEMDEK